MPQPKDDLSRSLVALDQSNTLIAVVELSSMTWLVGGMIPGVERDPLKKLVADADALLRLLHRWRDEAIKAGHKVERMVIAFEAGRDGFWLARWLRARGIEACVIHPTSIAVSREQRRAKTDRLDIGLLKRSFLGWLRGEKKHCTMAALPTLEEEDAKRPTREREQLVSKRTGIVNRMKAALARLGIRGFNPNLRKAPGQLAVLRTPEGCPLPPNTLAELTREMAHLRFIEIKSSRLRTSV
jgi:transposase